MEFFHTGYVVTHQWVPQKHQQPWKGSVESTHRTGGAKLGGWRPEDKPVGLDDCKSPVVFHRVVVCTEMYQYYQSPRVEYFNF